MIENFHIRPLETADTEAIVALYNKASERDPNIGPITTAQWVDFVQRPHNRGGCDFRVALRGGQLVGLAESSLRDQGDQFVRFFKLVVEPPVRRQGLGTLLLEQVLALDAPAPNLYFQTLASGDWRDGIAFLEARGFTHIESEIGMRCKALAELSPALPTGVFVERCPSPVLMAAEVANLLNAAFAADVAFRRYAEAEIATILALEGQELWLVRTDRDILGCCRLELETTFVWLEQIAIRPSDQGRGLGQALAYHALKSADIGSERVAGLNVASVNASAQAVYAKLGFTAQRETRRYGIRQLELMAKLSRRQ